MASTNLILYETQGAVARITFNRPEKHNAVTMAMHHEFLDAMRRFNADPDTYIAVIAGNGPSFGSGRDISAQAEKGGSPTEGADQDADEYGHIATDKLVVTSGRGYAIGAGGYMFLGGDICVASKTLKLALAEVPTAVLGPYWIERSRNLPHPAAFRLAVLGERVSAEELDKWGLITELVEDSALEAATEVWVDKLLALPPQHALATKRLMRKFAFRVSREQRAHEFFIERPKLDVLNDTREAALAFVEKRRAIFTGK